ncbi:unnamed protein product [Rotaria sordida]|uniref:Reverse transcriptase domain-containing protein n=2 Tax=Rotaria sordida TaxID=392033 RepID=A0A815MK72_9BILA|nr:unnamed protein product [Rotaria sordida]
MNQTGCYSFIFKLSCNYPTASQNRLAKILERVETTLNNLFQSKSITEAQYMAIKIDRSTVRMNYLYFVSDTHKEGIPVQPIMVCNEGPTMGISRYHGRLLGLLFNDATHYHSIQGIKIATILQLVRLVLDEQYFIYNYNFYRQTTGSASGSSLTIPLVYIYLFYWQPDLLEDLINKNELFFRYRDEAFITWNRSEDELRTLLAMANA